MEIDATCDDGGAGAHDCRQVGILREFGNIANGVSDEDFHSTMQRTPRLKRVKWTPLLQCLRKRIQDHIALEWSSMWKEENMSQKLETLEMQKDKFSDASRTEPLWRPQLEDVKAQLRGNDAAILRKKKYILETKAKEYEGRVSKLKRSLVSKRGYARAVQAEIYKCQKKNSELCKTIQDLLDKHSECAEEISPSNKEEVDSGVEVKF